MTRHLTPSERRARASAQAAITRAQAHTRPAPVDDDQPDKHYPVTPTVARALRAEIGTDRPTADWWPAPTQEQP